MKTFDYLSLYFPVKKFVKKVRIHFLKAADLERKWAFNPGQGYLSLKIKELDQTFWISTSELLLTVSQNFKNLTNECQRSNYI